MRAPEHGNPATRGKPHSTVDAPNHRGVGKPMWTCFECASSRIFSMRVVRVRVWLGGWLVSRLCADGPAFVPSLPLRLSLPPIPLRSSVQVSWLEFLNHLITMGSPLNCSPQPIASTTNRAANGQEGNPIRKHATYSSHTGSGAAAYAANRVFP
jgi:hypothetical protein